MMKARVLLLALLALSACSHKNKAPVGGGLPDSLRYPFQIKHADYWELNPMHRNTHIVLNVMKAFEQNDTTAAKPFFADSILVYFDGGEFKGTRSGMLKIVSDENKKLKKQRVRVTDFQSLISKNRQEEWVTVWSTQNWQNPNGKKDSINYVDNIQLKGGKIIKWFEYSRNYRKK